MSVLDEILAVLRGNRFNFTNEDELQQGIHAALLAAGLPAEREVRFDQRSRIDHLVADVGIETKLKGSASEVERQICRYALYVKALVVVTIKASHLELPAEVEGVPITTIFTARAAL